MLPIAIDITDCGKKKEKKKDPKKEIIYSCSNCGQDFRIFGPEELYCHFCGERVEWKYCRKTISHPLEIDGAMENTQETLDAVNKQNKERQEKDEWAPDAHRVK